MAEPIQNPRVAQALQSAFNIVGRLRPQLEEFVVPTVLLGDLGQNQPPYVSRHAVFNVSAAAGGVGNRFTARFEVPAGALARVDRIHLQSSVNPNNLRVHFPGNAATIAAQATVSPKRYADGRLLPGSATPSAPASVFTHGAPAAALGTVDAAYRLPTENGGMIDLRPNGWFVGTGVQGLVGFMELQLSVANTAVVGAIEVTEFILV